MRKRLLITSSLAMLLGLGVAGGLSLARKDAKSVIRVDAAAPSVTKIVLSDAANWCFRTLWLESFSFSSGYSADDLADFIEDYYVTEKSTWDKQGTVKSYHEYNGGYNLCAGGSTSPYTFLLPTWVTTCKVTIENNGNSYYMNYLDNLYKYSNNTGGGTNTGGVGKQVNLAGNDWGGSSSIGSAATESSFETTVSLTFKADASTTISTDSVTMSKYDTLSQTIPFGYELDGWYTNSNLTTAHDSNLPLGQTTLYGKVSVKKVAYLAGSMNGWSTSDDNYLMTPAQDQQFRIDLTLNSGDEFKVVYNGGWYGWANLDSDSPVYNKAMSGTNNIVVNTTGKYEIYIKTDSGVASNKKLWIQRDSEDEAIDYATTFLASITCNGSSTTFALNVWNKVGSETTSMEYKFEQLTQGAKHLLNGTTSTSNTTILGAIARYDYILGKYGYGTATGQYHDFMGRTPASLTAPRISILGNNSNSDSDTTLLLAVVASTLAILGVGGYFFLRRKKEQ